jgi:hypothetical protein
LLGPESIEAVASAEDLIPAALLLFLLALLAAVLSLVQRYRAAEPIQRQQLKWLGLAGLVVGATVFADLALPWPQAVSQLANTAAYTLVPIAIAIAVLRYRLYDIDRIINRTLVYGVLTAVLGTIYGLCVIGVRSLVGRGGESSQWIVAASTLLVAALFQPLRARIQSVIDRRFYRSRYDAIRTTEAFGARLRDEVALDAVSHDLISVVRDTLSPAHSSLWLRAGDARNATSTEPPGSRRGPVGAERRLEATGVG